MVNVDVSLIRKSQVISISTPLSILQRTEIGTFADKDAQNTALEDGEFD